MIIIESLRHQLVFVGRLSLICNGFLTRKKISRLTQPIKTKHVSFRGSSIRMNNAFHVIPSRELTPSFTSTCLFFLTKNQFGTYAFKYYHFTTIILKNKKNCSLVSSHFSQWCNYFQRLKMENHCLNRRKKHKCKLLATS